MADDSKTPSGGPPPKLDLRKSGVLKAKEPSAGSVQPGVPEESKKITPITIKPAAEAATVLKAKPPEGVIKIKPATAVSTPAPIKLSPAGAAPPSVGTSEVKTLKAVKPASAAAPAPAVKPAAPKSETSRIPLEAATAMPVLGNAQSPTAPKTIRIKPTASQTAQISLAGLGGDEKRKTSRISLEAALADGAKSDASDAGPKTIKLKRPTEPAVKIGGSTPSQTAPPAEPSALNKTSQLDDAAEPEDGPTPTRRRTIKVKRPTQSPGRAPVVARSGPPSEAEPGEDEDEAVAGREEAAPVEDQPHLIFSLVTIAAILVVCVTVYMLMAQTFGMNVSLTQLSYGAPQFDLGWPGKLSIGQ